jgi:hypothetical protein
VDPLKEYQARLTRWRQEAEYLEMRHRRTGNLRLIFAVALLAIAAALFRWVPVQFLLTGIFVGIFFSGMIHDRVIKKLGMARQLVGLYERGLDRLSDRWMGKGSGGAEFLKPHHPYAIDLDILGPGSLFEFVNTTQTGAGHSKLAEWLLSGAGQEEIAARRAAIQELRNRFDLREGVAMRTVDHTRHINTNALLAWAARPLKLTGLPMRILGALLALLTYGLLLAGEYKLLLAPFSVLCVFALAYRRRTALAFASMNLRAGELKWLAELLALFENENFQALRLRELQSKWRRENLSAAANLRRLATLADWMDSSDNEIFKLVGGPLLKAQFGFALASWHARHNAKIPDWLLALGEMEALCSLAGYAGEHPEDVFPDLVFDSASPSIAAQGLAHPLVAESRGVRNDLLLDSSQPLHVVSGSNMSGKSTWLRAIGTNLVLALAGAPVRARAFRMTPLQIGASIRTVDSLQEGISRFYAEIKRLHQIVQMADRPERLVFLIDEVLAGTNSHDRQIGAAFIVKALVDRKAVGLITTHDLALTQVVDQVTPPGANFHFEDQMVGGKLSFDYQLQPGVVKKSNALDLMRSIGLDVQPVTSTAPRSVAPPGGEWEKGKARLG